MKKLILLVILISTVVHTQDFRKSYWGDSMNKVKKTETGWIEGLCSDKLSKIVTCVQMLKPDNHLAKTFSCSVGSDIYSKYTSQSIS